MSYISLDPELLKRLLDYDPISGRFLWKDRWPQLFTQRSSVGVEAQCRQWNAKNSGSAALSAVNTYGYLYGMILSNTYLSHRVAWAIHYGAWPDGQIDHQDGDRVNNKIENLRVVSNSGNQKNKKRQSNNTSGFVGICWDAGRGKWRARIKDNGKQIQLGQFDSIEEAKAAREVGEKKYGYHKNHGRISV